MPPDAAYVEAQLIDTLRGGVGHARTRLNALQATVDQTVGSLRQRCADTLSQLEAEATRRGQLEVELSAVRERALTFQRRAEAAEDRLRAESLQQPSMKLLPEELAALREEVAVQTRRADEAVAEAAAAKAASATASEHARRAIEEADAAREAASTARTREAAAVELGEAMQKRVESAEETAREARHAMDEVRLAGHEAGAASAALAEGRLRDENARLEAESVRLAAELAEARKTSAYQSQRADEAAERTSQAERALTVSRQSQSASAGALERYDAKCRALEEELTAAKRHLASLETDNAEAQGKGEGHLRRAEVAEAAAIEAIEACKAERRRRERAEAEMGASAEERFALARKAEAAERRAAEAERLMAEKVSEVAAQAHAARDESSGYLSRANAAMTQAEELRKDAERERASSKRAATRAAESHAVAEARSVELTEARRSAARMEAELEEMRRHQALVGQHHHALAAHASALHSALAHGARSGLGPEQLNLLLATSQLLQRSVQQLRQRHEEMVHALGLPAEGTTPPPLLDHSVPGAGVGPCVRGAPDAASGGMAVPIPAAAGGPTASSTGFDPPSTPTKHGSVHHVTARAVMAGRAPAPAAPPTVSARGPAASASSPSSALAYARTPLERAAAVLMAEGMGAAGGEADTAPDAAASSPASAADGNGIRGLIAELDRREAQAAMAAATSDAMRWKAQAEAAERSREATEVVAQSRAHAAASDAARWRAEAQAELNARIASELAHTQPNSQPAHGSASSMAARFDMASAASPAVFPTPAAVPTPALPTWPPAGMASAAYPPPPSGAANLSMSAEEVAAQVMEQINQAAEQLKIAETKAKAAGAFGADFSADSTAATTAAPVGADVAFGGRGSSDYRYCASPSMIAPSLMATPSGGGLGGNLSSANISAEHLSSSLGPLSPPPPPTGRLDDELSKIDKEIEHLQNALASATRQPAAGVAGS